MNMTKVLVVGATGYLGLHIIKQLQKRDHDFVALARNGKKLLDNGVFKGQIIEAEVSDPQQLQGACEAVDVVISCLGITRQKDGLSYMDVDYQANLNVLREAEKAGVQRFIYISAFKAQVHPEVRMLQAKERFATVLLNSTIPLPCVIRPNGFFVDMEEIYHMAAAGKVYVFGNGKTTINPIHGADLADYCLANIHTNECELDVGGPEALSVRQIAQLAFQAQGKTEVIRSVPDWIRRFVLFGLKRLPQKWAGPAEFFLTMLEADAVAPLYGERSLAAHYQSLAECR